MGDQAPLIIPGRGVAPVFIAFRKAVKIAFLLKLRGAAEAPGGME